MTRFTAISITLVLLVLTVFIVSGGGSRAGVWGDPGPPDVVLVVLDTLRRDHLSVYGYARRTTPVLDGRKPHMRVFTDATTQAPQTAPAIASVFTGQPPRVHGLEYDPRTRGFSTGSTPRLTPGLPTVAERFKAAGYATFGVTTNPWMGGSWGFGRGFDTFVEWREVDPVPPSDGRRVLARARRWLDHAPSQPRFLYAHFMDVHVPYAKGHRRFVRTTGNENLINGLRIVSPQDLAYMQDLYDSDIHFADGLIGQLFALLNASGRAWVAFVIGDHGDEFNEHGGLGHGTTLYEELLRVPMIVAGRRTIDRFGESTYPLELTDVTTLMLAMARIAPSPLLGLISSAAPEPAVDAGRIVTSELSGMGALRQGTWKYIVTGEPFSELLFDLARDPGERVNAARRQPERTEDFRRRARELWPALFSSRGDR